MIPIVFFSPAARFCRRASGLALGLVLVFVLAVRPAAAGAFENPVRVADLDPAAFTESVTAPDQTPSLPAEGPAFVLWTTDHPPLWSGTEFGKSAVPGARHLRIGFRDERLVGTVLTRGGGQLSVLRPEVEGHGDLSREADWLPAERLQGREITRRAVGREEYAVWTLPPGTRTRALRFTHLAAAADPGYAGWLGGAMVLADRFANLAPQAVATARAREDRAAKSNDAHTDFWDNGAEGSGRPVTAAHPEWLTLVWPRAVALRGVATLWTGFRSGQVERYRGPENLPPRGGDDADWAPVRAFEDLPNGYPNSLWPNWLDFAAPVSTRALRLRLTAPTTEDNHSHLAGSTKAGTRVWLGEILALQPLGDAPLARAILPVAAPAPPPPPIAVRFRLAEPGYVTLVIEDAKGRRVRNLVAETWFPAGPNTAWWDGTDDHARDRDAARHGLYHLPGAAVTPGEYRVRGLVHAGIRPRYEFSIYNPGTPPWETADTAGGWLTNHSPPQAALFVPADTSPTGQPMIYLGSAVSEGGTGLAWVDPDGKKIGGRRWIGGNWTAAPTLARDEGPRAETDVFAYVGSTWSGAADPAANPTLGELRLTALTAAEDRAVITHRFTVPPPPVGKDGKPGAVDWIEELGAIAARDGVVFASFPRRDKLLAIDARAGRVVGEFAVASPRGLAFDAAGRLLVLSGDRLLRSAWRAADPKTWPAPETLIARDLQRPEGLTLDAEGRIYVSDHGTSHQVKVFSPAGKFLRAIGVAGVPRTGRYDPQRLDHPAGLAIDERGQLWITEKSLQPKRVSVWSRDGTLRRAFYGPGQYGGGGTLDPRDRTRFYYHGMEFRLDWTAGTSALAAVFYRRDQDALASQFGAGAPETPLFAHGRQYLTNAFTSSPTNGIPIASLWRLENHHARPVASLGRAHDWDLLATEPFRSRWPAGLDPKSRDPKNAALFAWSDANADARVQPEEIAMVKGESGGITVLPDLSFLCARVGTTVARFAPRRFTGAGVPIYDLAAPETLALGAQSPPSTGGDQALLAPDGWTVLTTAPAPWAPEGFGGVKDGQPQWSYPSLWPGLHASHEAPVPTRPGEITGSTRLLGGIFSPPPPSEAGPMWGINGNLGMAYLFTSDGLFVTRLFQDIRRGRSWSMPSAPRHMPLDDISLHDENFYPNLTQTRDGQAYLCDGSRMSLVRLDGLESIRRLPAFSLSVSSADLVRAAAWRTDAEAARQLAQGPRQLEVALRSSPPQIDGQANDWRDADWGSIDRRGTAAFFNSPSRPYDVTGAVAIAGDRLYAAFRTTDADLLRNSGRIPLAPFKTGDALDLMIGTNPKADPARRSPVAGDLRLLVTLVEGKPRALLYRAVAPGSGDPVPFSSPSRVITFDRVDDVSRHVQLAHAVEKPSPGQPPSAVYELSIPLSVLGLRPEAGQEIRADLGILRGDGFQTLQRVYWSNKATGITADVPSEAELTPALWGTWRFRAEK